jgi:hypothetical protein
LGDRPDNLPKLTFGRNGKPCYFSDPYDNPQKIIQTLKKSVGEGNYEFVSMEDYGFEDDLFL